MAAVLKVACQGQVHQFDLGSDPDYATVDAALRSICPGMTPGGSAKYIDPEGDLCTLVESTFRDFITTSSMMAGPSDPLVLKLLLPAPSEQPPSFEVGGAVPPVGPRRRHRRCPASPQAKAAWEEDDRDLEELLHEICGTEEEFRKESRARRRRQRPKRKARFGTQDSQQMADVVSEAGHIANETTDNDTFDVPGLDSASALCQSPKGSQHSAGHCDGADRKHEACGTRADNVDASAHWHLGEAIEQPWDAEEEEEEQRQEEEEEQEREQEEEEVQPWELGSDDEDWGIESWHIGSHAEHDWGVDGCGWTTEQAADQGWSEYGSFHHNVPVLRLPARRSMEQVLLHRQPEAEEELEDEDVVKLPVRSSSCPCSTTRLAQPLQLACSTSEHDNKLPTASDAASQGRAESVSDDGRVATTCPPWPATPEFTPPSSSRCAMDNQQVIWVPMQMWVPVLPLVQSC